MEPTKSPAPLAGGKPGEIRNDWAPQSITNHNRGDHHLPPATNFCQCAACGLYFGGVTGFEAHRVGGQCADPAAAGLTFSNRGYWVRPASKHRTVHCGVRQTADIGTRPCMPVAG